MTGLTDTQVVTASGGLVELGYSQITSNVTVNSNNSASQAEVISPLTVVCDGGPVLVEFFANNARPLDTAASTMTMSLWQDGSESVRQWGFLNTSGTSGSNVPVHLQYRVTPSAGSHTFGVKAFTNAISGVIAAGTGTSTTSAPAFLRVSKIVTATQWPAVTTGTIICTSTTRPASPFEGQEIWETDTRKEFTYTGAAWIQTGPPPRRLALQTATGAVTAQSTVGSAEVFTDLTFTADGTSTYRIETHIPYCESGTGSGAYIEWHLTNGSTSSLGMIGFTGKGTGSLSAINSVRATYYYAPTAGTVTLNVSPKWVAGSGGGGGGLSGVTIPASIAVYGPDLT